MDKLKICIPYYSEWKTPRAGIADTMNNGVKCSVDICQSPYVAQARNLLINGGKSTAIWQDIDDGFTHFLFVDSDIGFAYDNVKSLLDMNVDVACCPYLKQGSETEYTSWLLNDPGVIYHRFGPETKGIKNIDGAGGGFMLVKAGVFGKIRYPWFRYGMHETETNAEIIGEDICFCMALKKANINIWCNFDEPVYHKQR